MKRWYWLSIAIGFSCLPLLAAGDFALAFEVGAIQRSGIYKEFYGSGRFTFGGVVRHEVIRLYRSKLLLEFDFDFERGSEELVIEHIAGQYAYERTLSRSGLALRLGYQYNFSKDGVSFAAGLQRDFEKETLAGLVLKRGTWRPTISAAYELNMSQSGRQRIYLGIDIKFNVDGRVEAGLMAGLKMSFKLLRKFEV